MGKWKAAAFPAAVACVLALAAWLDWWTLSAEEVGVTMRAGLLGGRVCGAGMCMSVPVDGLWAVLGPIVLLVVAASALVFVAMAGAIATDREHDGLRALAGTSATLVLGACGVALADALLEYSAMPSWGPFVAIAGALAGVIAQKANVFEDRFGAARSETPVPIAAPAARAAQRPAPIADLRFACALGSIEDDGIRADDRVIAWSALAYAVARRLPPDPPWEKATFVDLVPTDGAPVRLTASTRIDYTRLPGGAAPTAKENWRRLIALARERNASFRIERTSIEFFDGGEAPIFPAWKKFLEYDARYA